MEPERAIAQTERTIARRHPIRSLFLVDVLMDKDSRPTLLWGLGILVVGTTAYHWLEGWSFIDSLYFCVISLATIGYGDFTPTTPEARLFTIFYVINGIVILLSLFDRIRAVRAHQ
jgi:voltage-gated potassium channel